VPTTEVNEANSDEVGNSVSTDVGEMPAAPAVDAAGPSQSDPLSVEAGEEGLSLTVASDQTVDEGALLSIIDIGTFEDWGDIQFDGEAVPMGEQPNDIYTFTINWGDGTPDVSGPATIDMFGSEGEPTVGSFDGSHTYADNGIYTVTVTLTKADVGSTSGTFTVTVDNVAPSLTVPGDQTIDEGSLLSLPNIGQFTDPGFDNLLNAEGEITERFTFAIDWGDGTPLDSGPATIDVPGSEGTPTAGSFDGSHTYADNGIYTVTVFLSDDDGATVSESFLVTVGDADVDRAGGSDDRRRIAVVAAEHRPVHRSRFRQPAECRRRNNRAIHVCD
jgi:hypothetical protein